MKIQELRAKRSRLLSDAQLLLMAGLTTPELKEKYAGLIAEADAAEDQIRMLERLDELDSQPAATVAEQRTAPLIEITERPQERRQKINAAGSHILSSWGGRSECRTACSVDHI